MRQRDGAATDYDCMGSICARKARRWVQDSEGYWYAVCMAHFRYVQQDGRVTVGPSYGVEGTQ